MITKLVRIDELHMDESAIEEAGRVLAGGGLVAFPTETVLMKMPPQGSMRQKGAPRIIR